MKSSIYCTRCLVLYSIVGNTISLSSSENESENDENTDGDVADYAFESPTTEEIDDNGISYTENLLDDQK